MLTENGNEREPPLLTTQMWDELRLWHQQHGRHHLPWRDTRNPWLILLAETLLHRTRADIVEGLYPVLSLTFISPESVIEQQDRWREITRGAGLAWRAQSFIAACRALIDRFGGAVPADRESLMALPGVGHYIASAVRCFGFEIPETVVDTNTIRLAARISGEAADPTRHRSGRVQRLVARLRMGDTPPSLELNYALLDLAAGVCMPKAPLCSQCPLVHDCATGRLRMETIGANLD